MMGKAYGLAWNFSGEEDTIKSFSFCYFYVIIYILFFGNGKLEERMCRG